MKFTATVQTTLKNADKIAARYLKDVRAASIIALDRASKDAQRAIQAKIRGVGLGRLAGAVGQISSKQRKTSGRPFGAIFAKGGDESLAGGALESYSRGAFIHAQRGRWLAFPTAAVPRFISVAGRRYRTTPELYNQSALVRTIGKLVFKPISNNRALLVIQNISLSPKNGQAKALGPRGTRTRVPQKEVIAFVLIRATRRAQRFDKDTIAGSFAGMMPRYMARALEEIQAGRGR